MAVAIDHAGDDRGAACIDEVGLAGIFLGIGGSDPHDAAVVDEHAHPDLEGRRAAVGERRVPVERSHGSQPSRYRVGSRLGNRAYAWFASVVSSATPASWRSAASSTV